MTSCCRLTRHSGPVCHLTTTASPQDGASLEVTLWDGTFSSEECPPLRRYDSLLAALQPLEKYSKHKSQKAGPPVNAVSVWWTTGGRWG